MTLASSKLAFIPNLFSMLYTLVMSKNPFSPSSQEVNILLAFFLLAYLHLKALLISLTLDRSTFPSRLSF